MEYITIQLSQICNEKERRNFILTEKEKKKIYLNSYGEKHQAVKVLEEEIEKIRTNEMCPSITYKDMPSGNHKYDLSDYAAKLDELLNKLKKARYQRIETCTEIVNTIEMMENEKEKNVLRLRYICGKTWEEVSLSMGYEWAQIHRIHDKALNNFKMG